MNALGFIILLISVFGLAYFRAPILIWTIVIGIILILLTALAPLNYFFLIICWLLYLSAALFSNLDVLRRRYITAPIIQVLQKRMPQINESEKVAIEAGNVWWEKELFCGRPKWKNLLSFPKPTLSSEEKSFLDNQVETLCAMIDDWKVLFVDRDLPEDVWHYLKKEGFFGLVIPKEYGGRGFSALAHSSIVVKIATRCVSAAVNTMVPNSLGPAELLLHYGTPEQKNHYLPKLASGEIIPSFALTGPEAGSDAGSIKDSGIVCYGQFEDKQVLGIRLTWEKRYITLAPVANVLGIAFRMYDPDHLVGNKEDIGITLCLVPTTHPGVEIGHRHVPLQLAFMNGPTRGKDVFIPLDWIIGGKEMAGQGWRMLMESLSVGRSLSLPALSTACGKLTYRCAGAYARLRKQFNVPISEFEGIEEALGYIAGYTYILEACRMMTAGAVDLNVRPAIVSAIAKYHMTEMARKTVSHAMDIHAGHGIQMGPRNVLATKHLAIPVSITVEGANILTRNLIIFGQGAIRCHPYILQEVNLFSLPDSPEKTTKLDKLLLSHVGYLISNLTRAFWCGLTGGRLIFSPVKGPAAIYYRQLSRMSSALALLADMSMLILGGNLKRKERLSARLGDILSHLYIASTVLKYFHDNNKPQSDMPYVDWCLQMLLYEIQVACDELLDNFPMRWLGKILKGIIFPWGVSYRRPSDALTHSIVSAMLKPSDFRERLTQYCFVGKEAHEPLRRLEIALSKVQTLDPIWKKFQKAVKSGMIPRFGSLQSRMEAAVNSKVLNEDEMTALIEFDELYQEVIRVNEFSFDLSSIVS